MDSGYDNPVLLHEIFKRDVLPVFHKILRVRKQAAISCLQISLSIFIEIIMCVQINKYSHIVGSINRDIKSIGQKQKIAKPVHSKHVVIKKQN